MRDFSGADGASRFYTVWARTGRWCFSLEAAIRADAPTNLIEQARCPKRGIDVFIGFVIRVHIYNA
jgi:hypothetical protein